MTPDMWHVTCDIWHVTHDKWHIVEAKHSFNISAPRLLRLGIVSVLKILNERMTESHMIKEAWTILSMTPPIAPVGDLC